MRDVRTDFPRNGVSMKLFHEWYQKDKNMDILKNLKTVQVIVKEKLMMYATTKKLAYVASIS